MNRLAGLDGLRCCKCAFDVQGLMIERGEPKRGRHATGWMQDADHLVRVEQPLQGPARVGEYGRQVGRKEGRQAGRQLGGCVDE